MLVMVTCFTSFGLLLFLFATLWLPMLFGAGSSCLQVQLFGDCCNISFGNNSLTDIYSEITLYGYV